VSAVAVGNALPGSPVGRFNYCVPLTNVKCHTPTIHVVCLGGPRVKTRAGALYLVAIQGMKVT
jgi:hypothetical protein